VVASSLSNAVIKLESPIKGEIFPQADSVERDTRYHPAPTVSILEYFLLLLYWTAMATKYVRVKQCSVSLCVTYSLFWVFYTRCRFGLPSSMMDHTLEIFFITYVLVSKVYCKLSKWLMVQ